MDWADESQWRGALEEARPLLERYRSLLERENSRQNLVGESTLHDFEVRHVTDSAQLLRLAPRARVWADIGSGAGLPGLVLAILLRRTPGARVHLIESVGKKCRFLCAAVRALGAPAVVHHDRAERLSLPCEVVTARACAPLTDLLGYARPMLKRGAVGLFLKGEKVEGELAEARRRWIFDCRILSSVSDPRGRVVRVSKLRGIG